MKLGCKRRIPSGRMRRPLPKKVLAELCQQLADLMGSGLTITESLDILSGEKETKRVKQLLEAVKIKLLRGMRFSEALSHQDGSVPKLIVAMCQAGEKSGELTEMLRHLGRYYRRQATFEGMLFKSALYPVFVLLVTLGVVLLLSIWILPVFAELYRSMAAELPPLTRILLRFGSIYPLVLIGLGISAGIGTICFKVGMANREFRRFWGYFTIRFPVFGILKKNHSLACFFQALGLMMSGGVDLVTAMEVAMGVLKNDWLSEGLQRILDKIRNGVPVSRALVESCLIGNRGIRLIMVGEASGELDRMFLETGEVFRREGEKRASMLTTLLEPLTILIAGAVVFVVVLAVMTPVFGVYRHYAELL